MLLVFVEVSGVVILIVEGFFVVTLSVFEVVSDEKILVVERMSDVILSLVSDNSAVLDEVICIVVSLLLSGIVVLSAKKILVVVKIELIFEETSVVEESRCIAVSTSLSTVVISETAPFVFVGSLDIEISVVNSPTMLSHGILISRCSK